MIAVAIRPESLYKNECPIEGHAFLPNKKARNPACPSLRRCKQYQDGNDGSVKTFRELSIKASTNVVNETDNRLLKSGKDIQQAALPDTVNSDAPHSYLSWPTQLAV